ncbi:MAG: hypothetical protein IPG17_28980 [Sandaracinaceae bacterium]|nr:hypothetical protein [Sandaracinaceae bacterium]
MAVIQEQFWVVDESGRALFGNGPEVHFRPEWGVVAEQALRDGSTGSVSLTLEEVVLTAWRLVPQDVTPALGAPGAMALRVRPVARATRFDRRPRPVVAAGELTPRQLEVCEYAASGATVDEIAAQLGISAGTVRTHLKTVYRNLDVANRVELARALGLLGSRAIVAAE